MAAKAAATRVLRLSDEEGFVNARLRMGAASLLAALPDGCAALAIFDPQYRGIMEKMKFGNEGARQKARAKLRQMSDDDITHYIGELGRVLRPSGHLALWCDKFTVGSGAHPRLLRRARDLSIVDLIHWNALRFGMGKRTRGTSEYLVIAQKAPLRATGVWIDHRMLDSWPEQADRSRHPHAKPHQLVERLIRAVTKRGDLVVDPAAGGFGVLDACRLSGRRFVGCDVEG